MPRLDPIALCFVLASVPLRLALAAATELSPDEAYYLSAARLGFAIPDHPPGTLWLLRLTDLLPASWPLELRARAPWLLIGLACSMAILELARHLTASPASQRWAALLGSWLLLPIAGGFLATPDAPAFLAATLLVRSELSDRDRTALPIAVASCLIGVTFKLIVAPLALIIALASKRSWKRRSAIATAACVATLWGLPSLRFQLHHVFVAPAWSVPAAAAALLAAVTGQLLLWMPLTPGLRRPRPHPALASSLAAATALLALFVGSALLRAVPPEPNWIAPAAIPLIAAAALALPSASALTRAGALVTGPVLSLVLSSHVLFPWLPIPRRLDPSARLHGWAQPNAPADAPGLGPYAVAAERCVYRLECEHIREYLRRVTPKR